MNINNTTFPPPPTVNMPSVNFAASPAQEISPKTTENATTNEYFSNEAGGSTTSAKTSDSVESSEHVSSVVSDQTSKDDKAAEEGDKTASQGDGLRRQSSVSSVNFQLPRNQNLPQGSQKRINKGRLRNASPAPDR